MLDLEDLGNYWEMRKSMSKMRVIYDPQPDKRVKMRIQTLDF